MSCLEAGILDGDRRNPYRITRIMIVMKISPAISSLFHFLSTMSVSLNVCIIEFRVIIVGRVPIAVFRVVFKQIFYIFF